MLSLQSISHRLLPYSIAAPIVLALIAGIRIPFPISDYWELEGIRVGINVAVNLLFLLALSGLIVILPKPGIPTLLGFIMMSTGILVFSAFCRFFVHPGYLSGYSMLGGILFLIGYFFFGIAALAYKKPLLGWCLLGLAAPLLFSLVLPESWARFLTVVVVLFCATGYSTGLWIAAQAIRREKWQLLKAFGILVIGTLLLGSATWLLPSPQWSGEAARPIINRIIGSPIPEAASDLYVSDYYMRFRVTPQEAEYWLAPGVKTLKTTISQFRTNSLPPQIFQEPHPKLSWWKAYQAQQYVTDQDKAGAWSIFIDQSDEENWIIYIRYVNR